MKVELTPGEERGTISCLAARVFDPTCGAVAQLGERLNGIQEVVGSTPIGSTRHS